MNEDRKQAYAERFGKVLDHIEQHLGERLGGEQLADVAHFSRFHFHRQFAAFTGMGVARYVLLMRLRRATYQLAFDPQAKVIDVALDAGFDNPESFSRAFRHTFGTSPSAFRQQPDWQAWEAHYGFQIPERNKTVQVDIVQFDATQVAVIEHRGPTETLNGSVARFIEWRRASGLSPVETSRTFGIVYDNPETTPPEDFRFDVGGEVMAEIPANAQGVVNKAIPGGRCARVRHLGSHMRIGETIRPLYRDWLPGSGEELRDYPLVFHYLNLLPHTPEGELLTDIYLPLK